MITWISFCVYMGTHPGASPSINTIMAFLMVETFVTLPIYWRALNT